MECYNHINLVFNEMIDDVKYIKLATFAKKINR